MNGEIEANYTHYIVGKKVRKAIADIDGTMPEDFPTPEKSLKQLEKENKKLLFVFLFLLFYIYLYYDFFLNYNYYSQHYYINFFLKEKYFDLFF